MALKRVESVLHVVKDYFDQKFHAIPTFAVSTSKTANLFTESACRQDFVHSTVRKLINKMFTCE